MRFSMDKSMAPRRIACAAMLLWFAGGALAAAQSQSVKPGINERWKSRDVEPLVATLEAESREIYEFRDILAAVAGPAPGATVADIGAGSGFMVQLFSAIVGDAGKVFAVDINEAMMERLAEGAARLNITNIETVVCPEDDSGLAPNSVDLVFICDTYHHFEYPYKTMASIHAALRPGGQIVLVDFNRVPGVTSERMLEHVRAGEEVFTQEIVDAGFEVINRHSLPMLTENYIVRFRKVEKAGPATAKRDGSSRKLFPIQ